MAIAVQAVRGVVASKCAPTRARLWQIKVNRTTKDIDGFPGFLAAVATALLATMTAATHAQEAPAAPQAPSSAPAASSPSATTPAPSSPSSSSSSAATTESGSKSDPVCFKLTGHCVDTSKTATKAGATKTAKTGKKLNLTAPDVSTVVPEQELKEPLPNPDQVTEVQEAQTVSVKTNEGVPPDVPGGLGAIWWAVVHPSQAWRIVTPAE
jgi:hypothetical protein